MTPLATSVAQAHINDLVKAACRHQQRKDARLRRTK